jgi:hypothetical protein
MLMITLTENPDRVQLYSFIISFGLLISIIVSIIGLYLLGIFYEYIVAGVLFTIIMVIIEFSRRNSMLPLYKLWNRLTRSYSLILQKWVNGICFYAIINSVGLAGKNIRFSDSSINNPSMWQTRSTLNREAFHSQYNESHDKTNRGGKWIGNYIRWSISTRNKWILGLLPFIVLLKMHKIREERKFPANIYTLY